MQINAQNYQWDGLLHGIHPVTIELEKKGTWVIGNMYAARDTFELEGSWNEQKIELLEFHNGLWTAKIKLEKKNDKWSGYWVPRTESEPFLIEFSSDTLPKLNYKLYHPESELYYLSLSPVSGLDYFGHTRKEEQQTPQYFYYNPYVSNPIIGLNEIELKESLSFLLNSPGVQPEIEWPSKYYIDADYHTLIEVFVPVTSDRKVDSVLSKWKNDFIKRLRFQKTDLSLKKDEGTWEKNRWYWNAHAFVEVYAMTEKCWSMALHTMDLKGRTDVKSFHYFPHKEELFFLETEIRNWEKFIDNMTSGEKKWDEWIFHPAGIIAINPFSEEKGIERKFLEDDEIKRYYRFFSPLRRIE